MPERSLQTFSVPADPATEQPYSAAWIVRAPWAHPLWHSYAAFLYDLTTPHARGEPTLHMEGATHEFIMYALDPDKDVPTITEEVDSLKPLHGMLLQPANHGYQFKADSDDEARERVHACIAAVNRGELSPDTDFRSAWDGLWKDATTLHRSAFG